jgi:hypothetical protein
MACLLNADDVLNIYSDIYENFLEAINSKSKTPINPLDYIKTLHSEIADSNDPKFALEVVQAIPQIMLQVIATRSDVRKYISTNKIDINPINNLSVDFEKIENVGKFIAGKAPSLKDTKSKIAAKNKADKEVTLENPEDPSENEDNKTSNVRIEDPITTTFQYAKTVNPDAATEEELEERDPEKNTTHSVVKQIIGLFDNRPADSDEVIYQGVSVALRPLLLSSVSKELLVSDDVKFLEENEEYQGIIVAVSDIDGNILNFDEEGNIVDDGKIAYQYLRDLKLKNSKLALVNRSGYEYQLVSPEQILKAEDKKEKDINGLGMSQKQKENRLQEIQVEQKQKMNDLYRIRQFVMRNPDEVFTLKITGGSYGNFKNKFISLSETGLDLNDITTPIKAGGEKGYIKVRIKTKGPGGLIDHDVLLQRGDVTPEIADKIATVLTTDALYRGKPLSDLAKHTYANVFLDNAIKKNNIRIDLKTVNGINELQVSIKGEKVDLDSPTAYDEIKNHLLKAVEINNKPTYPANLNYTDQYIGGTFTDYIIKDGKVTTKKVNYFDFIKPHMKIEFSKLSGGYFVNSNSYLSFAVPEEILPVAKKNYNLASVTSTKNKVKEVETQDVEDEDSVDVEPGEVVYNLKKQVGFALATENAQNTDVTLNIAVNFDQGEAKIAKRSAKNHVPVTLNKKRSTQKSFGNIGIIAGNVVKQLNKYKSDTLNVAGNDIVTSVFNGYTQQDLDQFMNQLFERIVNSDSLITPIKKIVTTGDSGISEAAIKAAKKTGIGVEITVPSGWTFFVYRKNIPSKKYKISNLEEFKARFGDAKEKKNAKRKTSSVTEKAKARLTKAKTTSRKTTPKKTTKQANKKVDSQIVKSAISTQFSLLSRLNERRELFKGDNDELNRLDTIERRAGNFFERLFTTKAQRDSIFKWWENHELSKHIPLEIITEVVNSNAFATWSQHGITLHMANRATPIDLYHEAWHGFTQLFLTPEQKEKLYDEVRKIPKFENATSFDIEEVLAEDYRDYIRDNTLFTGFIGTIYKKIRDFLRAMFGRITRQDMTRPQDIAVIKELYDKLYRGEILDLEPSIDNIMFTKLNRTDKRINLLQSQEEKYSPFSPKESDHILKMFDTLVADNIKYYNSKNNSKAGVVRVFADKELKTKLYYSIKQQFADMVSELMSDYKTLALNDSNDPAIPELQAKIDLLIKALDNFGNIDAAIDGKNVSGVIGYMVKKSRFNQIQEEIIEDPNDLENTRILQDYKGNVINPKKLASPTTLALISTTFKVEKTEDGQVLPVLDYFGLPQLEDLDVIWNKLAKVLEGSFDYQEMYQRLTDSLENYPEFKDILDSLRSPVNYDFKDKTQWRLETNFWQDFKKPRVKFLQYNINKNIVKKKQIDEETGRELSPEVANYESVVTNASFAISSVISDWKFNFITSTKDVNPYIDIEDSQVLLNTGKLIDKFSDRKGNFIDSKSREFLEALGIYMDRSSAEINAIFSDPVKVSNAFFIPFMFEVIKLAHKASQTTDVGKVAAAQKFKSDPITYLLRGLDNNDTRALVQGDASNYDVASRIKALATLQNAYSDGYSNFSVLTPEGNRVWEQVVDNTITRIVTAINKAKNWQELTSSQSDPNGVFKHMRWLANENNPYSKHSKLLNSIFILDVDESDKSYGEKRTRKEAGEDVPLKLNVNNIGGTQLIVNNENDGTGASTASLDATSKYLQEMHTMLLNGIEEFMRHASKNTAMSLKSDQIETYPGKTDKHLYVDIDLFSPKNQGLGEEEAFEIILGYIASELDRINRYKNNDDYKEYKGYNRKVYDDYGKVVDAGSIFTAFDDVLSTEVKDELYKIEGDLFEALDNNPDLRFRIQSDVENYFDKETKANLERLESTRYVDANLFEKTSDPSLSQAQRDEVLVKAYTYNSWIHKFETLILAYGDLVQYDHSKEEFHKRNAGLGSGGRGFRSDIQAIQYINSLTNVYATKYGYTVRPYDGTLKTAIMREKKVKESIYYKEYLEELTNSINKRIKDKAKAAEMAKKALSEYLDMKEGDGQGYITLEAYRKLKELEGKWTDQQDLLYNKIANGEKITAEDVVEYFPSYKLQYFGAIESTGLAVTSFHKFSLAPIIPFTTASNSYLEKLNKKMMEQKIDYVTFETGSKVSHIGSGDVVINEDGSFNDDAIFTENTIFTEFLKNQTEINSTYKGKSIFSTQLRKLILEGLYEKGVIDTTEEDKITDPRVRKYLKDVSEYSETLRVELLEEIGFEKEGDKYVPKNKDSITKLTEIIRDNLTKEDVVGDHLIDIIDVTDSGSLAFDLSIHPEAVKIEKLLTSIINKRLIKQQFNGEPLVQVSAAFYTDAFGLTEGNFKNASDEQRKKWLGSNVLPTYHKKKDGFTAAMKVAIALQGDYNNLLNLEYKGNVIGDLDTLNLAIKDDEWLDANDGANRKAITMVAVRIPVQGLNSMEFMEVYHFLPPQAGNVIIPPTEIVAKSGADFDIDKMTVYMNNINEDGTTPERFFENIDELKAYLEDPEVSDDEKFLAMKSQKQYLQNSIINSMKELLELPQNYTSLITPNGTFLVKELADDLSKYVMEYDPFKVKNGKERKDVKSGKKSISPTRVLESLYNLYKHESNVVGKNTLGLGAVENTFHTLINSVETEGGVAMPAEFMHGTEKDPRQSLLWLRHNTTKKNGKELISIASRYDVDGINKIADVISQLMNGWVDVEKDAWVFFVQGNYEVAPILLYLLKTGVPVDEAVYFVSQPLVREYVKEQRLAKSTFADVLGKKPESRNFVRYQAASEVLLNALPKEVHKSISNNRKRYELGLELAERIFKSKKNKHFTKDQMLDLIVKNKKNPEASKSALSVAMFLHYLQIEQQITGLTELKMAANPDTSTDATAGEAEQSLANIERVRTNSKNEDYLFDALRNDSIISSLFNYDLILSLNEMMFPLRYNKAISDYLMAKSSNLREDSQLLFGDNKTDVFMNTFRNDIISFLFQQAARKFKMGDSYKSYILNKSVPTKLVDQLKFGAYVKKDPSGVSTMYIDQPAIESDFDRGVWINKSEEQDSYANRGLYPLTEAHFHSNATTNKDEYVKFVTEREYLRSIYPKSEITKTLQFEDELKNVKAEKPELSEAKAENYTYEKILAIKALDNTLNPYHMFNDPVYAYAVQFNALMEKYGEIKKNYSLLNKLKPEPNKGKNMFNLYVAEKDFTNDSSNLYYENLQELSNPAVQKVSDPRQNQEISDFFSKLSMYAFMQTGINKTKFNFNNIVDFKEYMYLINDEISTFTKALENPTTANKFLDQFYQRFVSENSKSNKDRGRYKNYLFNVSMNELAKLSEVNTDGLTLTERYRLMESREEDQFIYDNIKATPTEYNLMLSRNENVTFAYPAPVVVLQDQSSGIGDSVIRNISKEMSVGFATSLLVDSDALTELDAEDYEAIKNSYDAAIERLLNLKKDGKMIAFPLKGIGNAAAMPQELFVYLSRRLYQEFGYLNPGSTMYKEISELVGEKQGISDAEILAELGLEEDPFACKI